MQIKKCLIRGMLGILVLLLLITAVLALSNRKLPIESTQVATLSDAEKARLTEAIQVRQQVGDMVWPGWETAVIPHLPPANPAHASVDPARFRGIVAMDRRTSAADPPLGRTESACSPSGIPRAASAFSR